MKLEFTKLIFGGGGEKKKENPARGGGGFVLGRKDRAKRGR